MHYHARLDKPDYHGEGPSYDVVEKNFRSLAALLSWIQIEYGKWSTSWHIEGIDGSVIDARKLLPLLEKLLADEEQWLYMGLNETCPDCRQCDAYCFTIARWEGPPEKGFSFSKADEEKIDTTGIVFGPNVRQSIVDILQSFEIVGRFDFVDRAFSAILESYCDEADVPRDVWRLKNKHEFTTDDYIVLADECQNCNEEPFAARLYVAGYYANGTAKDKGKALIKLADLYMNSEWPRHGGREWDVMKAVDLLTEALPLGCVKEAKEALEAMQEQLFEEYEDEPDVDCFIRNYPPDVLCLAAFCFGVGIGWKKDVSAATRLYEAALEQRYFRASFYLKEIRSGRVRRGK